MYFIYNIAVYIVSFALRIIAFFNKKIRLFVYGRKDVFEKLRDNISETDNVIWFHSASLGEFEQGRPIIEKCRKEYVGYKILVTFFSPSGYEIRKDFKEADIVTYLPLDTKRNAIKFLQIVNPKIAVFIKYEFWPNLLKQLKNRRIKTILISGIFRVDQSFFKPYGSWMKKSLLTFDHFFVQNTNSLKLLERIGLKNVTLSGDTRFDRVYDITNQENTLDFAREFKDNKVTLIAGSTWPKDEELLVNYINNESNSNQKFIIAPHNINPNDISKLRTSINKKVILFSEMESSKLSEFQVLIVDTIGLLSKIYHYADVAYVGGGFGTGIHNILEPATFGLPIIIGPNYKKFKEAEDLVELKSCFAIESKPQLNRLLGNLFSDSDYRQNKGEISRNYVLKNTGATKIIFEYLNKSIAKK